MDAIGGSAHARTAKVFAVTLDIPYAIVAPVPSQYKQ